MATIYSQNWSAGNSLFTSVNVYERPVHGVDPLYPEMLNAESVTVTGGKLDWSGTYGDYQSTGINLMGFPAFNGAEGSITCTYVPNVTARAVTFYMPLITVFSFTGAVEKIFEVAISGNAAFRAGTGPPKLEVDVNLFDVPGLPNVRFSDYPVAMNVPLVVKLSWKCGTPTGSPTITSVANDGWMRVYINGVLEAEIEDVQIYVHRFNDNYVERVNFGHDTAGIGGAGLFGTLDDILFETPGGVEPEPPEPPTQDVVPNAVECCSSPASPTTTDLGDSTPTPDPTAPVGDWTEQCEGTGIVPIGGAGSIGDDTWS